MEGQMGSLRHCLPHSLVLTFGLFLLPSITEHCNDAIWCTNRRARDSGPPEDIPADRGPSEGFQLKGSICRDLACRGPAAFTGYRRVESLG